MNSKSAPPTGQTSPRIRSVVSPGSTNRPDSFYQGSSPRAGPTAPYASVWDKYILDRYKKREEHNWSLGDQRMSEELRWSTDKPPKPQKPISCGNHDAPECRECTQGKTWGLASWCNGDCIWQDGTSCFNFASATI